MLRRFVKLIIVIVGVLLVPVASANACADGEWAEFFLMGVSKQYQYYGGLLLVDREERGKTPFELKVQHISLKEGLVTKKTVVIKPKADASYVVIDRVSGKIIAQNALPDKVVYAAFNELLDRERALHGVSAGTLEKPSKNIIATKWKGLENFYRTLETEIPRLKKYMTTYGITHNLHRWRGSRQSIPIAAEMPMHHNIPALAKSKAGEFPTAQMLLAWKGRGLVIGKMDISREGQKQAVSHAFQYRAKSKPKPAGVIQHLSFNLDGCYDYVETQLWTLDN